MMGRECDLVVTLWVSFLLCLCSVLYVYVVFMEFGEGCKVEGGRVMGGRRFTCQVFVAVSTCMGKS